MRTKRAVYRNEAVGDIRTKKIVTMGAKQSEVKNEAK